MYCGNCGKELCDDAVVCPYCGVPTQKYNNSSATPQTNHFAKAGFVLSMVANISFLGLIGSFSRSIGGLAFVGLIWGLAGFIFSLIGLIRAKKLQNSGKGLAIAGVTVGAVIFAFWLLVLLVPVIIALVFSSAGVV